jgi:hypothetical protein
MVSLMGVVVMAGVAVGVMVVLHGCNISRLWSIATMD